MLPKENGLRYHLFEKLLLVGWLAAIDALVELEQGLCGHSQAHQLMAGAGGHVDAHHPTLRIEHGPAAHAAVDGAAEDQQGFGVVVHDAVEVASDDADLEAAWLAHGKAQFAPGRASAAQRQQGNAQGLVELQQGQVVDDIQRQDARTNLFGPSCQHGHTVLLGLVQHISDRVVVGHHQVGPQGNESAGPGRRPSVALDLDPNFHDRWPQTLKGRLRRHLSCPCRATGDPKKSGDQHQPS